MTPAQKADAFVNKYNNTHIDEDGYYGAQCWDVVARYAREQYGTPSFPTGSGGAEGLYRLFQNPIPQYFDRIANNKSDPNQLPSKGDIIVWDSSFSPPWGHTAIVLGADSSGVTVFEQNGNNPGGNAYIKKRGWTGVSGWLSPKNKGGPEVAIIQNADNWRARVNRTVNAFWGRSFTEAEFQSVVGKDTLTLLEILGDNPETDNNIKRANIGRVAINDKWDQQIYGLQDQLKAANKAVSDANAALTAARQQLEDLGSRPTKEQLEAVTKQLQDAEKKSMEAQANYEKAKTELDKVVSENTNADKQTKGFLRALWRFITGKDA